MKRLLIAACLFTLQPLQVVAAPADVVWTRHGLSSGSGKFAISASANIIVTGGERISVFDLTTKALIRSFAFQNDDGGLSSLALSPDGSRLLFTDTYSLSYYDLNTGARLAHYVMVNAWHLAALHTRTGWLKGGTRDASHLYDENLHLVRSFAGGMGEVSPDDRMVSTISENTIHLYELETGALIRNINAPGVYTYARFSPNGQEICAGMETGVRVYRISDGSLVASMGSTHHTQSVTYSDDGKYIGATGLLKWEIYDDGQVIAHSNTDRTPYVDQIAFLPRSYHFAVSGQIREILEFAIDGSLARTIPSAAASITNISADGKYYHTTDNGASFRRGSFIIDARTGQDKMLLRTCEDPIAGVSSLGVVAEAGFGVSGRLIDLQSGQVVGSFGPTDVPYSSIAGDVAASYSRWEWRGDGRHWNVYYLDIASNAATSFEEGDTNFPLAVGGVLSQDGSLIACYSGQEDSFTHIYDVATHSLLYSGENVGPAITFASDDDLVGLGSSVISLQDGPLYNVPGIVLDFSPDSQYAIYYEAGQLQVVAARTGLLVKSVEALSVDSLKWGDGVIVFSGTADGEVFNRGIFDPITVRYGTPTGIVVVRGSVISGGISQLVNSDDDSLNLGLGRTVTPLQAPIEVEIDGTTSANSASVLQFKIESSASRTQIRQGIELYDYTTGGWVTVDSRIIGTSDGVVDVNLGENTSRFLQNGHLRGRVSYRKDGTISPSPWTVKIDQVKWTMAP